MSQEDLSTSLELNQEVYSPGEMLTARLSIRDISGDPDHPAVLEFSTGQIYDLEIRDDNGNVVYLWSRGKTFAQIITELEIHQEQSYIVNAELAKLRPGKYVAQGWFTADGPDRAFSASARFQIR